MDPGWPPRGRWAEEHVIHGTRVAEERRDPGQEGAERMEDCEVLGRMGDPAGEERERVRWLGVRSGPAPGPPLTALGGSLA